MTFMGRKEIENYVLEPAPMDRAIIRRIDEHNKRSDDKMLYDDSATDLLLTLSEAMKQRISGQFLAKRTPFEKSKHPEHEYATINAQFLTEFGTRWSSWETRKSVVPGKELLGRTEYASPREVPGFYHAPCYR